MKSTSLVLRLKKILSQDKNFIVAFGAVRAISKGKIWLIGSAVYKNLISDIHGHSLLVKDYDFLIEQFKKPRPKLTGWKSSYNFWGCLKLKKKNITIDVVTLDELISVKQSGRKATFRSWLWQVPFSIQSVGFEITTGRLVGSNGLRDIKKGIVRINNRIRYEDRIAKWGAKINLQNMAKKIKLEAL